MGTMDLTMDLLVACATVVLLERNPMQLLITLKATNLILYVELQPTTIGGRRV